MKDFECEKCSGRIVLHAFSEGTCEMCGTDIQYHNTPCPTICMECAKNNNICRICKKETIWT